jgi:hypothetical protein
MTDLTQSRIFQMEKAKRGICPSCNRPYKQKAPMIHRQKPCGLVGDSFCGEFKKGDVVTCSDAVKVTCKKCKSKMRQRK